MKDLEPKLIVRKFCSPQQNTMINYMHSDRSQKRIKGCDYKLACRCDDNLAFKTIILTLYFNFDLK